MARTAGTRVLCAGVLAAWLAGCGGEPGLNEVQSAATSTNALIANALIANALIANALIANSLTSNALIANALIANGLTATSLRDPLAREFFKYVVSCALDDSQTIAMSIDGVDYTFPGALGLAPQWGQPGGSCDQSCQRWVSACVLARVDAKGIARPISIRGANPVLAPSWRELVTYTDREAAYFGNLFVDGQPRYLCLAPGKKSDPRVCGSSLDDCPMDVVGSCANDCSYQGPFGGFVDCSTSGKARRPEIFHESVTVFLPR